MTNDNLKPLLSEFLLQYYELQAKGVDRRIITDIILTREEITKEKWLGK